MGISDVTQSIQFSRWFGDWQNHPDQINPTLLENGMPRVFYHGADANFTVFQKGDIGYHVGSLAQAQDRINGIDGGHGWSAAFRTANRRSCWSAHGCAMLPEPSRAIRNT